ncbi:MAG: RagB/SusD family nutrient uptake outer membrane protein [Balneolales bacterium]
MKNLKIKKMLTSNFYKTLVLVLLGTFVTVSCHDQLLNPDPESVLTTANFFNTADDIDSGVLGIYHQLQFRIPRDYMVMEVPTDNIFVEYYATSSGLEQIEVLDIATDNDEVHRFWQSTYNGIFRANSVLDNIDAPEDYLGNQKNQLTGEAKFLRAYYYFDLVRIFGGVPKITTQQSIDEAREVPRSSEQEIYDLIIEDLTDAVDMLPSEMVHGRASKAAAEALLGKVYVYQNNYTQARGYLENVLNDYNYNLLTDFGDLFSMENEVNSEAIFSLAYVLGSNTHNLSYEFNPNQGVLGYSNRGNRTVRPTYDLHLLFDEDDSRYNVTMSEDYIPAQGEPDDDPIPYPIITKYNVPNLGSDAPSLDLPVLRLADVILLYSEVLYELEGPNQALTQLNKVRERAFGDNTHNYELADIATPDEFVDVLLNERRLEFVMENERWFDIVRMDKLEEILGGELQARYDSVNGLTVTQELNAQDYMRYFPIPYEEITLSSPGVLEQNDEYNN